MRDSLAGDELFMFNIVHGRSLGQAMSIVRETEKTPPLFFIFTWLTVKLGDPTYWIRLPSLIFGSALVPLGYLLGVRTVGRKAGLLAAAMLALSSFSIFYGTEARAYAAVAFFAGLSTLCLLEALRTGRRRWWAAYGLAVLAVLYTHYMGVFVVVAQAAWAMWTRREHLRALVIVHTLVVLAYLPWLPSFLLQEKHSADEARRIAAVAPPTVKLFGKINAQVLLGAPFVSLTRLPGTAAVILGLGVIAFAAVVALARAWRARPAGGRLSSPVVLVLLLAVVTPIGVAVISLRPGMSFMLSRNLMPSLVPIALLVGWLITSLQARIALPAAAAFIAVLALGAVVGLQRGNRRTPYREVAHYIDAHARPGDPVIQQFILPTLGPLANVISINLSHPRAVYTNPAGAAIAWQKGRRPGVTVFLSQDLPGYFRPARYLPRFAGPGNKFVRVAERRYLGLSTVIVAQYRYKG